MNENEEVAAIEAALDEAIADGWAEADVNANGERSFRLTDQGISHVAVDLMGGRDLWNASGALWELIKTHGTVLGVHEPGSVDQIWVLFVIHRVLEVARQFFAEADWRRFVTHLEGELPSEWWTKQSRAFLDIPDQRESGRGRG